MIQAVYLQWFTFFYHYLRLGGAAADRVALIEMPEIPDFMSEGGDKQFKSGYTTV